MAGGLRERKRLGAMRTIQERALDLFDERGFGAVTIEEIAAAADVSPSSVYRYFGTKEGLLVADEFDAMTAEQLAEVIDVDDPVGSLSRLVRQYEQPTEGPSGTVTAPTARRRVHYFFAEPTVRRALYAALDRAGQRIAPMLRADGRMSEVQSRVAANALAFGYLAALEQWHLDGEQKPIATYVEEGLGALRGLWPQTGLIGGPEKRELVLVEHDPTWAATYLEHQRRISRALGDTAVQVEHIGSTAVPGLAAKPIIDILVTVPDLEAEDTYLGPLRAAGYGLRVREPGHRMVRTPARDVHVHILEPDAQAAHDYLLLRDHLRTNAADRELYEQTKRRLIGQDWPDMNAYADAKTEVIEEIKARARTRARSQDES